MSSAPGLVPCAALQLSQVSPFTCDSIGAVGVVICSVHVASVKETFLAWRRWMRVSTVRQRVFTVHVTGMQIAHFCKGDGQRGGS